MHISACAISIFFLLLSLFNLSNPSFIINKKTCMNYPQNIFLILLPSFLLFFTKIHLYLLTDKNFTKRICASSTETYQWKEAEKITYHKLYSHMYIVSVCTQTHVRSTHNEFNSIYRLRELKYTSRSVFYPWYVNLTETSGLLAPTYVYKVRILCICFVYKKKHKY